jgi:hypothetical protein
LGLNICRPILGDLSTLVNEFILIMDNQDK